MHEEVASLKTTGALEHPPKTSGLLGWASAVCEWSPCSQLIKARCEKYANSFVIWRTSRQKGWHLGETHIRFVYAWKQEGTGSWIFGVTCQSKHKSHIWNPDVKSYWMVHKRVDSEGVGGGGLQNFTGPFSLNINIFLESWAQAQSIGIFVGWFE